MLTASEINTELADAPGSVSVVYGGETKSGLLEAEGEVVLGTDGVAGVIDTDRSVVIATGVFSTALAQDAAITVDGDSYTIRSHLPFDDGKLTRIWLKDA